MGIFCVSGCRSRNDDQNGDNDNDFGSRKKLYSKPVYIDSVFLVTEKSQKQILTDRNQQQQNRPILVV